MATRPRKGRPRGFADWKPKDETKIVLAAVGQVLQEYRQHLPLTVRQIFYRLVGQYQYDKTEKAYARLCEYLVRARRAQMIPFESIRDDGTVHHPYLKFTSPTHFWEEVRSNADHYVRDKLADQPVHIELWCEAAGMVPQLERVANRYSVPVYSTGGFSSVTVTYEIAERALKRDKPTVFLHVGDYDPSGESIFDAQTRDAKSFLLNRLAWDYQERIELAKQRNLTLALDENMRALEIVSPGGKLDLHRSLPDGFRDLRPVRVALTGDQVEEYDLPTAPPKASDTRSVNWGDETCQLEALPPDDLADLIERAIEDVLDLDKLEEVREEEDGERDSIFTRVEEIIEENTNG